LRTIRWGNGGLGEGLVKGNWGGRLGERLEEGTWKGDISPFSTTGPNQNFPEPRTFENL
jgi:hypothetical protein